MQFISLLHCDVTPSMLTRERQVTYVCLLVLSSTVGVCVTVCACNSACGVGTYLRFFLRCRRTYYTQLFVSGVALCIHCAHAPHCGHMFCQLMDNITPRALYMYYCYNYINKDDDKMTDRCKKCALEFVDSSECSSL